MNIMETIGERILLSRRDLGIKQEQLAAKAGVSRTTVSRIERGEAAVVDVQMLSLVANALGVSVFYLMGATDDPLAGTLESEVDHDAQEICDMYVRLTPLERKVFMDFAKTFMQHSAGH